MKWQEIAYPILMWLALVAFCCLTACNTPKVVTVTEYRDRVQRDTVTAVDSVYIAHYVREKDDTVHVTDTIIKYKYLDKYAYIHVHDSIPYEVQVQVPVRVRNGYDRFVSWGFWGLFVVIFLRVAWWVVKTFYLRR